MRLLLIVLIILSSITPTLGQAKKDTSNETNGRTKTNRLDPGNRPYWLERSQEIERMIRKHSADLDSLTASALNIRLAQIWIKADPTYSQRLLNEGVSSLISISDSDSSEQLGKRFDMIASLLGDIGRISQPAVIRLQSALETIAQKLNTSKDPRRSNLIADTFATASLNSLQAYPDPARALSFAEMSLRAGGSEMTGRLVTSMAVADPGRAQRFADEILTHLQGSPNPGLLKGSFDSIVLGEAVNNPNLRNALLTMMADAAISTNDSEQACVYGADIAGSLSLYSPATRAQLEPIVDRCARASPSTEVNKLLSSNDLHSAEDIIAFAGNEQDLHIRSRLKLEAANLAETHGDPEKALDILDAMNAEERKESPETWKNDRANFAVEAAVMLVHHKDFSRLFDLIYRVPDETKLWVELTVADRLNGTPDSSAASDLLRLATKTLDDTEPDRIAIFSMFLNETGSLSPDMLPGLWPQVVNRLDEWIDNANEHPESRKLRTIHALYDNLRPEFISSSALVGDAAYPLAALDSMKHKTVRLSFELGILYEAVNLYLSGPPRPRATKTSELSRTGAKAPDHANMQK